ncbi:hypothetical protein N7516_004747 [Penicillium verrucosum]|uniref:uncharacterized protein n=1 Tax=Penicillium verrucosum TaxID=60171 RepID=UPI0025457700|nr:uncharacterized protein N7516_004747 [Penicillium verrucosum]KAJ5944579.1 hypothetical protein N7516_004747 [Penicillium verrucosum]
MTSYRRIFRSTLLSYGVDTILDYGRELIEEIKKIRNIKKTIEEDYPAITSLYRAIYGIILFTILYKGLGIRAIRESDYYSRSLLADFKNLIRDCKILPDYIEDKVPLYIDHSIVVKFDTRNAAGYRIATYPKPPPYSIVPFKKDPMFIGRKAMYHERVVLVGLAGISAVRIGLLADCYSYGDSGTGRSEDKYSLALLDNTDNDSIFFSRNIFNERGPLSYGTESSRKRELCDRGLANK